MLYDKLPHPNLLPAKTPKSRQPLRWHLCEILKILHLQFEPMRHLHGEHIRTNLLLVYHENNNKVWVEAQCKEGLFFDQPSMRFLYAHLPYFVHLPE